jgi:putative membrane protein
MMWGSGYGAGGWAVMIGSLLLSLVLIATVVIGAIWLVRTQRTAPDVGSGTSPQAILDARFARGEIDESELLRHRQVLGGSPPEAGTKN